MTGIMEHLLSVPAWLALLVVFALPALESSAFLGFVIPGETAVLMGGVVAGYLAGSSWHTAEQLISRVGLGITLAVLATLVGVRVLYRHRTRRRSSRETIGRKPVPHLCPPAAAPAETILR